MARSAPCSPRVGTARRRRQNPCGEAARISEKRRLRGLKSRAPTARRPYQLTRRVLLHHGAKRPMFPEGRDGAPPPFDSLRRSRPHLEVNEELRLPLKAEVLLTRDPRMKERKKPGQPGVISSFLLEGQLWCGGEFDCAVGFVKGDDSALEWAIVFEGNADLLAADEGGGLDGFG